MPFSVEYHITQYELEQGALEIQYIEEYFGEFPRKKTAAEIVNRLEGRSHLILLASAPLPDDPGSVVPVSFKVAHEVKPAESEPKLVDLVHRLSDNVQFLGSRGDGDGAGGGSFVPAGAAQSGGADFPAAPTDDDIPF